MAGAPIDEQLADLTQITARLQKELTIVQLNLEHLARQRAQEMEAEASPGESAVDEPLRPPLAPSMPTSTSQAVPPVHPHAARTSASMLPTAKPVVESTGVSTVARETTADSAGSGLELAIGGTWLNRIGAIAMLVGMAFFVKYAFDEGWISPATRVCLGAAVGALMVIVGEYCLHRSMRTFAAGVLGCGVGILYLAVFGAYNYYDLVSSSTASILYTCVTALSVVVAVHGRLLSVAVLAIIGGYGTPIALSTGVNRQIALLTYVLFLDVGYLVSATIRRWDVIRVLAWLGTLALFAGWYFEFYEPSALWVTWGFLLAFYAVFLVDAVIALRRQAYRWAVSLSGIVGISNAVFFAVTYLLWKDTAHQWLGLFAVVMGAVQWLIAWRLLPQEVVPVNARRAFWLAGAAMLSLAAPLQFDRYLVSVSWLVQGVVTLWFCRRYATDWLRVKAVALMILAVMHLFAYEYFDEELGRVLVEAGNFHLTWAMILFFAAGLAYYFGAAVLAVGRSLDGGEAKLAWMLASAGCVLILWMFAQYWERYLATWAWAVLALAWLVLSLRVRSITALAVGLVLAASGKFMVWDTLAASTGFWESIDGLVLNRAVFTGVVCSGLLIATRHLLRQTNHPMIEKLAAFMSPAYAMLIAMIVLTWTGTFEIARAFQFEDWPRQHLGEFRFSRNVYITAFWALNAAALWWCAGRHNVALAGYALLLTLVAGLKLLISDTLLPAVMDRWGVPCGVCANACFVIGILVIAVGFLAYRGVGRVEVEQRSPAFGMAVKKSLLIFVLLISVWVPTYEILRVFRVEPFRLRFVDTAFAMQVAVSVLWSLHATGSLILGFARRIATMRRFALALYLVTVGKVFLFDLARLAVIHRIVSFLVLGTLLLFASLLYQWLSARILAKERTDAEQSRSADAERPT